MAILLQESQEPRRLPPQRRTGYGWVGLTGILLAVVFLAACAGGDQSRRTPPPDPGPPAEEEIDISDAEYPAGVDTAVAREATRTARRVMVGARADSISEEFFRQGEQAREAAHPLVSLWEQGSKPPETPPDPADTMRAFEISLEVDAQIQAVADILGEPVYVLSYEELERIRPQLRQQAADKLETARDMLQQALTYNPWDNWSRLRLVETLEDLSKLHESLDNMEKAIDQSEILLGANKADYLTALNLADRYLLVGDSLEALNMYRHSEDLLLTWAPLSLQGQAGGPVKRREALDSLEYVDWLILVREQMFLEQDLKMGDDLVRDAQRLLAMIRPNNPADTVFAGTARDLLNWIAWDEGNVYTASARLPIIQMINEEKYEEARQAISAVIPSLVSPNARLEMDTLAAVLDFGYLDRPESALDLLRGILVRNGYTEIDSSLDTLLVRNGPAGFARRMQEERQNVPNYNIGRVLELYGSFTTIYANRLEKQDRTRERAFVYYFQSALLPHQDQAFALMALANLSSQNPQKAVLYGEAALQEELPSVLAPADRRVLYELMVGAYRNLNDLNKAEQYFRLLEQTEAG